MCHDMTLCYLYYYDNSVHGFILQIVNRVTLRILIIPEFDKQYISLSMYCGRLHLQVVMCLNLIEDINYLPVFVMFLKKMLAIGH